MKDEPEFWDKLDDLSVIPYWEIDKWIEAVSGLAGWLSTKNDERGAKLLQAVASRVDSLALYKLDQFGISWFSCHIAEYEVGKLRYETLQAARLPPGQTCRRCRRGYKYLEIDFHNTQASVERPDNRGGVFQETFGCWSLCTDCWKLLSPETRLPYYKSVWKLWDRRGRAAGRTDDDSEDKWLKLKEAVLRGE